jgi:hypothetical protein
MNRSHKKKIQMRGKARYQSGAPSCDCGQPEMNLCLGLRGLGNANGRNVITCLPQQKWCSRLTASNPNNNRYIYRQVRFDINFANVAHQKQLNH